VEYFDGKYMCGDFNDALRLAENEKQRPRIDRQHFVNYLSQPYTIRHTLWRKQGI